MSHCVYKIWSLKGDKVYYGSSFSKRPPIDRYNEHLCEYKGGYLKCMSKLLFTEYGVENCLFQIVEHCVDQTLAEVRTREKWWIQNNECVNRYTPCPSEEDIKNKQKKFRERNKEHKKEYDSAYRVKPQRKEKHLCEVCGGQYILRHKSTHLKTKLHREANQKEESPPSSQTGSSE